MSTRDTSVVIVGAGVAGLSLAIMLAQRSIPCQVLESRLHFDGATSGVRISDDGVRILRSMRVGSIGAETSKVEMRFGSIAARFTVPKSDVAAIVVTRLALHEQLMKRARSLGVPVTYGFKVAGVKEAAEGVQVTAETKETVTGSLLVGADGVGSRIRQILNPDQGSTKSYAGYLGVGFLTEDESKTEMTLHRYPGHQVGIASCGKVSEAAGANSVFMWTHIHMPEAEAQQATTESVEAELARRAQHWRPELKDKYDLYARDSESVLAFGPVYNGTPPGVWHGDRMMLIGDAAHPYGPGGQGISMALKDAKALCEVIAGGFGDDARKEFQASRVLEARRLGEAAEKRNAKVPSSSKWGIFAEGVGTKAMELVTGGKLKF